MQGNSFPVTCAAMDVILFTIVCYLCALGVDCFNVDTEHPIVLTGDKGSYFGYSVAFHNNSEGELALVTAPKGNFSLYNFTVHEPGVLYKCPTSGHSCKQVLLDMTGNYRHADGQELSYHDLKNNSWLGVSLDVQDQNPGHVVTCSHLWKNQFYPKHYLVNGVCYILNRELSWSATKKLLPLIERTKQSIVARGIYYYAVAQAGTSVAFSEDGKDLVIGAPGVHDWLGTVVEYRVTPHPKQMGRPVVPSPPGNPTPESYIGYSVTTGHFYELVGMSYVAGAPRDASNNGRVYIFEQLSTTKSKIVIQQTVEGGQLGEYFGSSVLAVDLTNNSFSDLLVGAPLHSLKDGGDEGRVYVFLSDGVGLQMQKELIMGSSIPFARFGTAIAKAGDLNQDGFQDVVIGAPYENDHGAIYIYHGYRKGLKSMYSQKVFAKDLDTGLTGFGISLAKCKDIDNNKYPDLLVGAYSSDRAVILRSRPVAQIYPRLEFDVKQVDLNVTQCKLQNKKATCFTLTACLKLSGKHTPDMIETLVELWADVSDAPSSRGGNQHQPRGFFLTSEDKNEILPSLIKGVVLQRDRESCIHQKVVVVPEDVTDIIQPMTFQMNFSIQTKNVGDTFCPGCPVLDPSLPTTMKKQIHFHTGCGEDNTCLADLKLSAHVVGLGVEEALVHGANSSIVLEVRVENIGEPAYSSDAILFLPPTVGIIKQAKCILEEDLDEVNRNLSCKLGNPLRKGHPAVFQVKLDISKLDYRSQELAIKIVASTASQEANSKNNAMLLRVPLKAMADITIRGYADREQILYDTKTEAIPVDHTYLILKYYPSPVPSVGVAISVPVFDRATRIQILKIDTVQVGDSQSATVPGSCDASNLARTAKELEEQEAALTKGGKDAPNTINLVGLLAPPVSKDNSPQNLQDGAGGLGSQSQVKEVTSSYVLNCGNSLCQTLICTVGPFIESSKVASIRIKATVNITAMHLALGNQVNVSLVTGGRVWIRDIEYDPQPYDHRPDADEVSTDFITAEQPAKPVEIWIIIVAVLSGLLLLAILFFVLYKLGFFRRKEKEEMERMMQKGALLAPSNEGPKGDNDSAVKEADDFDYINFANANT